MNRKEFEWELEDADPQSEYNRRMTDRIMRDEGDLMEVREPTTLESCLALVALSICAWAVVGAMGAGVWWLFRK